MTELNEAVESLLNQSSESRPTEDLKTILELLKDNEEASDLPGTPVKRRESAAPTTGNPSLRQKLGNRLDELKDCLCDMMADRVCLDDLLPMTYDEEANEDAMADHNALTLTNSAMLAAQLYVRLLVSPGAFSAGLVDLHVLSELPRIIARWRTECNGREWAVSGNNTNKHSAPAMNASNKQSTKRAKMTDTSDGSSSDSDDESRSSSTFIVEIADDNALTEHQLVRHGLELARLLADVPLQKHFLSWNDDCQSAIINALGSSMATTAALFSLKRKATISAVDANLDKLATTVIHKTSQALRNWMTAETAMSLDVAASILIGVQRNLYSLISLAESDLPNGEDGQLAAAQVASDVFQQLAVAVSTFVKSDGAATGYDSASPAAKTPSRRQSSEPDMSVSTNLSNRKKRAELRRSIGTSPTPLKLKNKDSINNLVEERRASCVRAAANSSLHPLVQKVASMIQRLLTDSRNSATRTRTSTCAAVEQCLMGSSDVGLIELALRWVVKMFESNADFHRLAAIKFGVFTLVNESLFEGVASLPWGDDDDNFESDVPSVLFAALQKRLCDLKQPVRIAAANEFITIFERMKKEKNSTLLRLLEAEADRTTETIRSLLLTESSTNGKISLIKCLVSLLSIGEQIGLQVLPDDVEVLSVTCQEAKSVMLRSAAAEGLTSLLSFSLGFDVEDFIMSQWSLVVLPLVLDPETRVQTKALSLVDGVIFNPIVGTDAEVLASRSWSILSTIGRRSVQPGNSKLEIEALHFAVAKRTDVSTILASLLRAGSAMYSDAQPGTWEAGLWALFHAVMQHKNDIKDVSAFMKQFLRKKLSFEFAFDAFFSLFESSVDCPNHDRDASRTYCLEVLATLAFCLDVSFSKVGDRLQDILTTFKLQSTFTAAAVRLLVASTISACDGEDISARCSDVVRPILESCRQEIASRIDRGKLTSMDEQSISRALSIVGELRMVGFVPDDRCGKKDATSVIASYGINIMPPDQLRDVILTLSSCASFAEPVRGHALVALGKMCLRDEKMAKDSLSVFVQALQNEQSAAIRSNALLCMGDMIVRYTNLADRFLPEMAACLQAGIASGNEYLHVLTRKHAILVISDLLLQDYIKWRGSLFPSFLIAAIDDDEEVALLAESMICGPLKKEKLFSSHFVESLFLFNGCEAHDMLKAFESLSDFATGESFSLGDHLRGRKGAARRQRLYELMLSQLTDTEKVGVTAGIAKDILARCLHQEGLGKACATDDEDDPSYCVLCDAFSILSNKMIWPRNRPGEDSEAEGVNRNEALRLKVRGALLHKVSRKHLIEHMVPVLVQIRELLKAHHSPLLPKLMEYLVVVFRLYPDEMKDNLSLKHPVLLQEIQFDAKRVQKESKNKGREDLTTSF